jgi:hypothetical protein
LVCPSEKYPQLLERFLVATGVLAHGKALALTLRIVLIVVLALFWCLVGALDQVRARVSGGRATFIVAVFALQTHLDTRVLVFLVANQIPWRNPLPIKHLCTLGAL